MNTSLKLPELTHPLILELGQDETGQPATLTFFWRRAALTRDQYARFEMLQQEEQLASLRRINQAAIKQNALLDQATAMAEGKKPKKGEKPSDDAKRYARLIEALDQLQRDYPAVEGEAPEGLSEIVAQQIVTVSSFIDQVTKWQPRDPEELEAEFKKQQEEAEAEYNRQLKTAAMMLAHLCTKFQYSGGEAIEATEENLLECMDLLVMNTAVKGIRVEMTRPLVIRDTAPS